MIGSRQSLSWSRLFRSRCLVRALCDFRESRSRLLRSCFACIFGIYVIFVTELNVDAYFSILHGGVKPRFRGNHYVRLKAVNGCFEFATEFALTRDFKNANRYISSDYCESVCRVTRAVTNRFFFYLSKVEKSNKFYLK